MSGYIIHFDNETELAHYGVKGMKWKKHKSAKIDYAKNRKRAFNERKYSFTQANINRLGNISKKESKKRYHRAYDYYIDKNGFYNFPHKSKKVMIDGKKIEDSGTGLLYDGKRNPKLEKKLSKILNKRYNKHHAKKGKNIFTKIYAKAHNYVMKKTNHTKTSRMKLGSEKHWSTHRVHTD